MGFDIKTKNNDYYMPTTSVIPNSDYRTFNTTALTNDILQYNDLLSIDEMLFDEPSTFSTLKNEIKAKLDSLNKEYQELSKQISKNPTDIAAKLSMLSKEIKQYKKSLLVLEQTEKIDSKIENINRISEQYSQIITTLEEERSQLLLEMKKNPSTKISERLVEINNEIEKYNNYVSNLNIVKSRITSLQERIDSNLNNYNEDTFILDDTSKTIIESSLSKIEELNEYIGIISYSQGAIDEYTLMINELEKQYNEQIQTDLNAEIDTLLQGELNYNYPKQVNIDLLTEIDAYKEAVKQLELNMDVSFEIAKEPLHGRNYNEIVKENFEKYVLTDGDRAATYYMLLVNDLSFKIQKNPADEALIQDYLKLTDPQKVYEQYLELIIDSNVNLTEEEKTNRIIRIKQIGEMLGFDPEKLYNEQMAELEAQKPEWWEQVLAGTGKTVMAVGSGIAKGGEGILDFATYAYSGLAMIGSAIFDLATGQFGMPNSETYKILNARDAAIQKKWVSDCEDSLIKYDNVFKWMENKSPDLLKQDGFAKNLIEGLSELAFQIAIGNGVSGAVGISQGSGMVLAAGIKGFGHSYEKALNEGANSIEAGNYAMYSSSWEMVQWTIGQKMEFLKGLGAVKGASKAQKYIAYTGYILANGADGGVESFVQPLLQKSYSDKDYWDLYELNGGNSNLAMQFAFGSILSALSVGLDEIKIKKLNDKLSKDIDTNIPMQTEQKIISLGTLDDEKSFVPQYTIDEKIVKDLKYNWGTSQMDIFQNIPLEQKSYYFKYLDENNQIKFFKSLTSQEQIDFFDEIKLIDFRNSMEKLINDNPPFEKLFIDRIIKEQDVLSLEINKLLNYESSKIVSYIGNNSEILQNLDNNNLYTIIEKLLYKEDSVLPETVLAEINKRLDNGEFIFNARGKTEGIITGLSYNTVNRTMRQIEKSHPELFSKIEKFYNYDYISDNLSNEMIEIINESIGNKNKNQLLQLIELEKKGKISDASKDALKRLSAITDVYDTIDFRLFSSDIIEELGEEVVLDICRFEKITDMVISIRNSNPKLYKAYCALIKNASLDSSLGTLETKIKLTTEYLYQNMESLSNIDYINLPELQEYILMQNNDFIKELNIDYSNNYRKLLAAKLDDKVKELDLTSEEAARIIKDAYFEKYFSISSTDAKILFDKYSYNLDDLMQNNDTKNICLLLKKMDEINSINDVKTLKNLYDSQNIRLTSDDILSIQETLRKAYANSYVEKFLQTNSIIENSAFHYDQFQGKNIKVIELEDDFGLLVYSSDTGFTRANKSLRNDSFENTFRVYNNGQTHGLSTSYISSENIGSVQVGDQGVLYGFTKLDESQIRNIGCQDLNSFIADYGFDTRVNEQFIMPDDMSKSITRLYSEFVLDRSNLKPDYLVLYSDASEAVKNNTLKAAADWGIDVVMIDVEKLAEKQISKVNDLLKSYQTTEDISLIKEAIDSYEAGASGFNLNVYGENLEDMFYNEHGSVKSIYESYNINDELFTIAKEIKETGNISKVEDFKKIIFDLQQRFANTNERENVVKALAKTKPMIDVDGLLEILGG